MDLEGKPVKKPFKPFLTQPRRNLKETLTKDAMDKMDALEASTVTVEIEVEDLVTEDHSSIEEPLVNLTKAPTPNIPESQAGQSINTKVDAPNVRIWTFPR